MTRILERWGLGLAVLLAVLLTLPSLLGGRALDDLHLEETAKQAPAWAILHKPRQDERQLLRQREAQWWVDLDGHSPAHLRPLGSLSHAFDYRLLPDQPVLWHLHSVLFYAAATAVAWLLYRRWLSAPVAGLSAILFAVDDGHGFSAGHLASRPTLIALVLGGLGLLAYDRAVRDRGWVGYVLGPVLVVAAMLSYELAAGFLGFVAAHLLVLDARPWKARLASAVPWVLAALAFAMAFLATGSGSRGSGLYTDPLLEPLSFAGKVLEVAPSYAASLLLSAPSDFWAFLGIGPRAVLWVVFAAASSAVAVLLRPRDRLAAFLAVGTALAAIPAFAAWPNDRLLPIASLGACALIGRALLEPATPRLLAAVLVALHLVVSPLLLPLRANLLALTYGRVHATAIPSVPADEGLAGQTLVVVNSPDALVGMTPFLAMARTKARAASYRFLLVTPGEVTWEREGETVLVARLAEGLLRDPFSRLNRSAPLRAGDHVALKGLTVDVLEVDSTGFASEIRFTFDRALEDPSFRWIVWSEDRYVPWTPPSSTRTDPPTDYRRLILGF